MEVIVKEDLEKLLSLEYIDYKEFDSKSFLITGATGLIGSALVSSLVYVASKLEIDITIYAMIRNVEKINKVFSDWTLAYRKLHFVTEPIESFSCQNIDNIDYILHAASSTDSKYMKEYGIELIDFAYQSTKNLLEIAKEKNSKFLYFSSMEVYGSPIMDEKIKEDSPLAPNTMIGRTSYPESKRLCECLTRCYYERYDIPAFCIRFAQCFGTKIFANDTRVFSLFAKSVVENKDIILKTNGASKRCVLYTLDAVSAIFTVLLRGQPGEAYNAANEDTYMSTKEMADLVCSDIAKNKIKVCYSLEDANYYPPTFHINLDCSKLRNLGWTPTLGIKEMFERFIATNY